MTLLLLFILFVPILVISRSRLSFVTCLVCALRLVLALGTVLDADEKQWM